MDRISKERRSWNMSRIRGADTKPERIVRSLLHQSGYRFRLHRKDLPGRPDIVLPRYQAAILVHGCFWHRHKGCRFAYTAKSRQDFWKQKFTENVERDRRNLRALRKLGWRCLTVWECETRNPERLRARMIRFLENNRKGPVT
jgi:DNA mismatch endonuclease, patch repair protein